MEENELKTPRELKALLAQNRMEYLFEELEKVIPHSGDPHLNNQLVLQNAKFQQYRKIQHQDLVDYDDLTRTRNNISLALLEIINGIPAENDLANKKKTKAWGISERSLKRQIFWLLAGGKMGVIIYTFMLWQTASGFTFQGFITVLAVIVPTFATYLGIVYEDVLKNRYPKKKLDFRIDKSVRSTAYFFFLLYYVFIYFALYLHGTGVIPDYGIMNDEGRPDYKNLLGVLALIESIVGGYIGILITTIFKEGKKVES